MWANTMVDTSLRVLYPDNQECVCVCVAERDTDSQREKKTKTETERDIERGPGNLTLLTHSLSILMMLPNSFTSWWLNMKMYEPMRTFLFKLPLGSPLCPLLIFFLVFFSACFPHHCKVFRTVLGLLKIGRRIENFIYPFLATSYPTILRHVLLYHQHMALTEVYSYWKIYSSTYLSN